MRPGDWICPKCGDLVFKRNERCRFCGTSKPWRLDDDDDDDDAAAAAAAASSREQRQARAEAKADPDYDRGPIARRNDPSWPLRLFEADPDYDRGPAASRRQEADPDYDRGPAASRRHDPPPSSSTSPLLRLVLGRWEDCKGASHDVRLDEGGKTCSVTTTLLRSGFRKQGRRAERLQERRAFIHVDAEGWVCWGQQASYYLDVRSATDTRLRWEPTLTSKAYIWKRAEQPRTETRSSPARAESVQEEAEEAERLVTGQPDEEESLAVESGDDGNETDNSQVPASSPSPSPASSSTGKSTEHSRSSGGSRHAKLVPHFCIFQGDGYGIGGWTRENGGRKNRWDTILLSLLQCVMMDGEWPKEVKASAFVGADAIHMSGRIQRLAMPFLGYRENGSKRYGPATCCDWEEMLWNQYGQDSKGLRWELNEEPPTTRHAAQETLLRRLDQTLDAAPRDSIAIVFDYVKPDATYEELKMLGLKGTDTSETRTVFLVLGGAHGFDGRNDADGELLKAILARFRRRLGAERVLAVDLCERSSRPVRLTTSKVAAFLSCEYARGTLAQAVAGVDRRIQA